MAAWWPVYQALSALHADPFERALACGDAADRVGWAFASGYQAALRALFREAPEDRICALCVTEADGNSPRAIRSTLKPAEGGWRLDGDKRWTTLGPDGALFFVAARDAGAAGPRPAIKVAIVPSGAAGLTIEPMPPARFVPEVPHAQLHFRDVAVAALLPGDGYDRYVKPFRTVEDIHVNAAILAYLLREARRLAWPMQWLERAVALLVLLQALAQADRSAPAAHIALAGALATGDGLLREADAHWKESAADPAALRWERDRTLLKVAGGLRARRTQRAWELLSPAG